MGTSYDARGGAGSLAGRVCVVTGATRGIGRAAARALAARGATLVLLARDAARAGVVAAELRDLGSGAVHVVPIDLASLASVRAAAAEVTGRHAALHLLLHDAGVNLARRTVTTDGIEATLAVNHLAPFLLTQLLLPALRRGAAPGRSARVVTVTSMFERFGRLRLDPRPARPYIGVLAYTASKLANVLFTRELARRLAGSGVTATCADPGLAATELMRDRWWYRAPLLRALWRRLLLAPERAADALVHAATSRALEGVTGECIDRRGRVVRTSGRSRDAELARRLWVWSEALSADTA